MYDDEHTHSHGTAMTDPKPRVEIRYCPRCRWLMRAGWMAQELLSTFEDALSEVALIPSSVGGHFEVRVGDAVVWDRKAEGGFPQPKDIKQRVRDIVQPGRDLGHTDGQSQQP